MNDVTISVNTVIFPVSWYLSLYHESLATIKINKNPYLYLNTKSLLLNLCFFWVVASESKRNQAKPFSAHLYIAGYYDIAS